MEPDLTPALQRLSMDPVKLLREVKRAWIRQIELEKALMVAHRSARAAEDVAVRFGQKAGVSIGEVITAIVERLEERRTSDEKKADLSEIPVL